jgi:chromosome segregation ATPase
MTTDFDHTVTLAAQREADRRKRVLMAYLAALVIPIAIGGYALMRAPSENEAVARSVTPMVQEVVKRDFDQRVGETQKRIDAQVESRVNEVVAAQAEPVIKREVAREVSASVAPQIESVRKELGERFTSIRFRPPVQPDPRLEQIPVLQEEIKSARSIAEAAGSNVKRTEQTLGSISEQTKMHAGSFEKIQSSLSELSRDTRENAATLQKLDARLDRLEKIISAWQRERSVIR